MIINHNLMANNAIRSMNSNTSAASKSMAKLSSGLRINGAADDAAGLAISEKMRGQIRGLDQASSNAQDGISMIQTAEGALNETTSILQRMRELADQSANGTYTDADRKSIQDEITQLTSEVDRIGNTTEFNTQKLLNGNLKSVGGATAGDNVTISGKVFKETAGKNVGGTIADASTANFAKTDTVKVDGAELTIDWSKLSTEDQAILKADNSAANAPNGVKAKDIIVKTINAEIDKLNEANGTNVAHVSGTYDGTNKKFTITSGTEGNYSSVDITPGDPTSVLNFYSNAGASSAALVAGTKGQNQVVEAVPAEKLHFSINGVQFETNALTTASSTSDAKTVAKDVQDLMNDKIDDYNTQSGYTTGDGKATEHVTVEAKDGRLYISSPSGNVEFEEKEGGTAVKALGLDAASTQSSGNGGMTFQIGANRNQTITFGIGDMRAEALGIAKVDVSTKEGAQKALDILDKATATVSAERGKLGAVQNRLEHTINNLGTASENLTSAESRIRDVDMAKEMSTFSKNNILSQAAQAMLAQANQQPQQVLQLLR